MHLFRLDWTTAIHCSKDCLFVPSDVYSPHTKKFAARILTRTRIYEHRTPILKNLHWPPVTSRIDYKILLLTYCAINNISPAYIQQLITPYVPVRKLRSEDMCRLNVPSSRLQRFGGRSFSRAAPVMWNNLPDNIRKASNLVTFKTKLKTHLFKLSIAHRMVLGQIFELY